LLAERCTSLRALELSRVALGRAIARRSWSGYVEFAPFDLRHDPLNGQFDLVLVAGVLEYFSRPRTFSVVREKLVSAVSPGGFLVIETTRPSKTVDDSWWARYLVRGCWINAFIGLHSELTTVSELKNDRFIITAFEKRASPK